ncbi:A/G-specific adenine glycosylase [Paraferrimonas haliotis]|nr:A/G-specific adenine glycosylase [Paraferrimonas haliotis]
MTIESFSTRLINWQLAYGRQQLPWQNTHDAYAVWLSEIMLQQTQVATVIPYYERFLSRFSSIDALANADIDDVLHLWTGLGYYARARNLHKAAKMMQTQHNSQFPDSLEQALELPGVGRSTASSILTFAKGQALPILDGNVKRVLARHAMVDGWTGSTATQKQLWRLSEALTPTSQTGVFNQGLMDLGSMVCKRSKPLCHECPVAIDCQAQLKGLQDKYPVPKPKKQKPVKTCHIAMIQEKDTVLLLQRPPSGIWGGLWCPPMFETEQELHEYAEQYSATKAQPLTQFRHTFSHYHLDINAWLVRVEAQNHSRVMEPQPTLWYNLQQPQQVGLAAATERLLQAITIKE